MKDKMLAAAMKPVTAVRVVDRSAQGFEAFERAFGRFSCDATYSIAIRTPLLQRYLLYFLLVAS